MVDRFTAWTWPIAALPEDVVGVDRVLDYVSLKSEQDVQRRTDVDHGGHFAAMEEPEILVEDLRILS
ncbi:hypothetical protein [Rhodococcus sp. NBC_00297]|uniref:hypothetical protein n=1 Tax=Rhodococcus sp. NBC_00297 TaxID=2976005 RepID=UPI002E2E0B38|nr:hypothetical protein [Rhodococcus sp. NBC_00297]